MGDYLKAINHKVKQAPPEPCAFQRRHVYSLSGAVMKNNNPYTGHNVSLYKNSL